MFLKVMEMLCIFSVMVIAWVYTLKMGYVLLYVNYAQTYMQLSDFQRKSWPFLSEMFAPAFPSSSLTKKSRNHEANRVNSTWIPWSFVIGNQHSQASLTWKKLTLVWTYHLQFTHNLVLISFVICAGIWHQDSKCDFNLRFIFNTMSEYKLVVKRKENQSLQNLSSSPTQRRN